MRVVQSCGMLAGTTYEASGRVGMKEAAAAAAAAAVASSVSVRPKHAAVMLLVGDRHVGLPSHIDTCSRISGQL
jgi:hypothetical protein